MTRTKAGRERRAKRRITLAALPAITYLALTGLVAALSAKPPALGWIGFAMLVLVGLGLVVATVVLFPRSRRNVAEPPAGTHRQGALVLVGATYGRRRPADDWTPPDPAKLSPVERRFVKERVEGHRFEAVVRGTFGGGNPDRLLDFPNGGSPR